MVQCWDLLSPTFAVKVLTNVLLGWLLRDTLGGLEGGRDGGIRSQPC